MEVGKKVYDGEITKKIQVHEGSKPDYVKGSSAEPNFMKEPEPAIRKTIKSVDVGVGKPTH